MLRCGPFIYSFIKNKSVGIFHQNGTAVVVGKVGNFPEAISVEIFIVDHIKVDTLTWVVADAEVGD